MIQLRETLMTTNMNYDQVEIFVPDEVLTQILFDVLLLKLC